VLNRRPFWSRTIAPPSRPMPTSAANSDCMQCRGPCAASQSSSDAFLPAGSQGSTANSGIMASVAPLALASSSLLRSRSRPVWSWNTSRIKAIVSVSVIGAVYWLASTAMVCSRFEARSHSEASSRQRALNHGFCSIDLASSGFRADLTGWTAADALWIAVLIGLLRRSEVLVGWGLPKTDHAAMLQVAVAAMQFTCTRRRSRTDTSWCCQGSESDQMDQCRPTSVVGGGLAVVFQPWQASH
jgi:hypothetical protein